MPQSIWDTRFTPPKVALDADVEAAFLALDDQWITMRGSHVLLNDDGQIIGGMEGRFHGQTLKEMSFSQSKTARNNEYAQTVKGRYEKLLKEREAAGNPLTDKEQQEWMAKTHKEESDKRGAQERSQWIRQEHLERDWQKDPPVSIERNTLWRLTRTHEDFDLVAASKKPPEVLKETKTSMLLKWNGQGRQFKGKSVELWVPKTKILNAQETRIGGYEVNGKPNGRAADPWRVYDERGYLKGEKVKEERIPDVHGQKSLFSSHAW